MSVGFSDLLKFSKMTISFHFSSVVHEVIKTISSLFTFFYEKILSAKKAPKRKQTIFTLLEVLVRAKNCCLYCLLFASFVLLVGFCLWRVFVRLKFFRKRKKINRLVNVLIASCGFYCIAFIEHMLPAKTLLDYTNLLSQMTIKIMTK